MENTYETELIELANLQDTLRIRGGLEEDGALYEQIIGVEENILNRFGLPIYPDYLGLIQFDKVPDENEINTIIEQLKIHASAHLLTDAKTDIQILKEAQVDMRNPFYVLPDINIATHVYTLFVYHRIFLNGIDTAENVLNELKLVNNNPGILGVLGELGQLYQSEDFDYHYGACEILTDLDGEEKDMHPTDIIKILKERGVRYIDQYLLSFTQLLTDDEVDEINRLSIVNKDY